MLRTSPIATDLIIGMTLAEVFLLILFVVWYSQGAGSGPDWEHIAELRQQQIEKLQSDLLQAKNDVAELERIRNWWRSNYGIDPPASAAEFEAVRNTPAGQKLRQELARGFPKCEDSNVLADVSMLNGVMRLNVSGSPTKLIGWSRSVGTTIPKPGDVLSGPGAVDNFLQTVARYYEHAKQENHNCRFDYKLRYITDHDYREGRETFEKLFYPATIAAVH